MRLERQKVVRAALQLLNEVGLDGLTTRRLAEALGVQSPALYWHFKNKQELIDEMARALLADAYGPLERRQDWSLWLAEGARRLRREMLSYRDGARVLAGYRPGPEGRIDPEVMFGPLQAAGFGLPDAIWAVLTVGRFTFGWTMDEQAAVGRSPPPPERRFDPEEGFEFGLSTIIAGLKARVCERPGASAPAPNVLG